MKLKYYMRGIGIGIIFTVFVFTVIVIPNLEFEEITQLQESVTKQISDSKVSNLLGNSDKVSGDTREDISEKDTSGDVDDAYTGDVENTGDGGKENENPSITPEPTVVPTSTPTSEPTATPTPSPTPKPTATPTPSPTPRPTATPTPSPTPRPTATPTPSPTPRPTATPTPSPTPRPTATPAPKLSETGNSGKVSVADNADGTVSVTIKSGCTSEILSDALQKAGAVDSATDLNKYIVRNGYASRIQTGTFKIKKGSEYKDIASAVSSKKK